MGRAEPAGLAVPRAPDGGLAVQLILGLLLLAWAAAAAAGPAPGLSLYGGDANMLGQAPQLETRAAIRVSGMLARVVVEQRFRNPGADWVEGIYVFPLPDDAAVDRLRMRYGGRRIEGEIQARDEARRTYDKARAEGRGASLLDQERENVFTTSVANIPPGESVEIVIEYQQPVGWSDGAFSLRFPMVVAPRYIPGAAEADRLPAPAGEGWATGTDQVPDASRITPPVVAGAGEEVNPVSITAELDVGLPLADIASPYHPVQVEQLDIGRHRVSLARDSVPAERDFVLRWRPRLAELPTAALFGEHWRDRHYAMLMVMPPSAASSRPAFARELILVVDSSGSMHGESLDQARAALKSALLRLAPGDRFNLIRFNHETQALFPHAVPADATHLAQARRYVEALGADGGTEMLPAMRRALHDPQPSGLLRQVVFLTDGAVGNESALFREVAENIGASRLFTVGIGSAPNGLFMRKAARLGRGTFTYIGSSGEVEATVARLFRQLGAPVLTDVTLRWQTADGSTAVEQAPERVPDLYAGEPLVVAAQAAAPFSEVLIEGRLGSRPWQYRLTLTGGASAPGVHALWARRMIEDWSGRILTGADREAVRDAVLALALEHRLVSRYTSLVAVDRTPSRPADSGLRTAPVPARLPAGWSADRVFGRLPGTATPAPLYLLIGLGLLVLGWVAARRRG